MPYETAIIVGEVGIMAMFAYMSVQFDESNPLTIASLILAFIMLPVIIFSAMLIATASGADASIINLLEKIGIAFLSLVVMVIFYVLYLLTKSALTEKVKV